MGAGMRIETSWLGCKTQKLPLREELNLGGVWYGAPSLSTKSATEKGNGAIGALRGDAQLSAQAMLEDPSGSVRKATDIRNLPEFASFAPKSTSCENLRLLELSCTRIALLTDTTVHTQSHELTLRHWWAPDRFVSPSVLFVLKLTSLLAALFGVPQELQEPSKKLATRVKRFFSAKKDRLSDIVPRFVVVDGMER